MKIGSVINMWSHTVRHYLTETAEAVSEFADSAFGSYTVEEQQLLLDGGISNGGGKQEPYGVPQEIAFTAREETRLRDRTGAIPNARYGLAGEDGQDEGCR